MFRSIFTTEGGFVNLHPTKATNWVVHIIEKCFDSNGCPPPNITIVFIIKRNGYCVFFSEEKKEKFDNYCTAYCLNTINT